MGIVKRLSVEFTAFCEVVGQPDKGKCLPVDLSVNHRDMGRRRSNRRWGSIIEHVDGKSSGHGRMFDVDDANPSTTRQSAPVHSWDDLDIQLAEENPQLIFEVETGDGATGKGCTGLF